MTTSRSIGAPGCRLLSAARDKPSPTSFADVPRVTSPVLGPPESSRSRAVVAHAGLEIRAATMLAVTRDFARGLCGESAT